MFGWHHICFLGDVLLRWFCTTNCIILAKYSTSTFFSRSLGHIFTYTIFVTVVLKVPRDQEEQQTWLDILIAFYFGHWSMQLLASDSSQRSELFTFLLCVPTTGASFLSKIARPTRNCIHYQSCCCIQNQWKVPVCITLHILEPVSPVRKRDPSLTHRINGKEPLHHLQPMSCFRQSF